MLIGIISYFPTKFEGANDGLRENGNLRFLELLKIGKMLTPLIELSLERDRKTWNSGPFNSVHHHRKFEGVNHVEIENLK